MAVKSTATKDSIYQLNVTLCHTDPPIWRRVQVRADTTLGSLHDVIQVAMGWADDHSHRFIIGGRYYGLRDRGLFRKVLDEHQVKLADVVRGVKATFIYEYDFGDSWEHDVHVEKIMPPHPGATYPACVAGRGACPPEDCGGVWGYYHLLEVLQNPSHPEHAEMMDWVGGPFDPECFDVEKTNKILARLSRKTTAKR